MSWPITPVPWATIRLISSPSDVQGFTCGHPSMDQWVHKEAYSQQRQGNVTTWLCLGDDGKPLAFFSLKMHVLTVPNSFSNSQKKRWGVNSDGHAPAFFIAKLGLHVDLHGQGLGHELLREAQQKCVTSAQTVACKVIALDAIDHSLIDFYTKAGFVRIGEGLRFIRPTSKARLELNTPSDTEQ